MPHVGPLLARLAGLGMEVERGRYLADDPLPCTVDRLGLRFVVREPARRRAP